jgi:hypothetical protein
MKIKIIKSKVDAKTYLRDSLVGGFLGLFVLSFVFVGLEPKLSTAAEDQLTITQVITSEISFSTPATDVTMTPQLTGLTGGTSNGTSTVIVLTNNTTGYTMTIVASTSPAMKGYLGTDSIPDYTSTATMPDFAYSVPSGYEFGYSVGASTTADLAQKFLDNGSVCATGSSDTATVASCWYGLSTVATSTILRTTQTPGSGSTSSLYFKVTINSGSSVTEDTYQATTTLTATTN